MSVHFFELILPILTHFILGFVLVVWVWGTGCAILKQRIGQKIELSYAYPLGLVFTSLLGITAFRTEAVISILGYLGIILTFGVSLLEIRTIFNNVNIRQFGFFLIPVFVFILIQGLRYFGPTPHLEGNPMGDTLQYLAQSVTLRDFGRPINLLVEGFNYNYLQHGPMVFGGLLSKIPFFDFILFFTVSLSVFLFVSLYLLINSVGIELKTESSKILFGALFAGAFLYPSWISESPPVCLALPLVFSVVRLVADNNGLTRRMTLEIGVFIFFAAVLSKVVALASIFLFWGSNKKVFTLWKKTSRLQLGFCVMLIVGLCGTLLASSISYLSAYRFDFLPLSMIRAGEFNLATLFAIMGEIALLIAVLRAKDRSLFIFSLLSVLFFWLWPVISSIVLSFWLITVCLIIFESNRLLKLSMPLGIAIFCILVAAYLRESDSYRFAPKVLVLLFLIVTFMSYKLPRWLVSVYGAVIVLGLSFGFLGQAIGKNGSLYRYDKEIWQEVRSRTLKDSLVFTELTGGFEAITFQGAWNYYAGIAGRQIYLAGWISSPLNVNHAELKRRLEFNSSVLKGDRKPESIPLSKKYSKYYGVLYHDHEVPKYFELLFKNSRYALYSIPNTLQSTLK